MPEVDGLLLPPRLVVALEALLLLEVEPLLHLEEAAEELGPVHGAVSVRVEVLAEGTGLRVGRLHVEGVLLPLHLQRGRREQKTTTTTTAGSQRSTLHAVQKVSTRHDGANGTSLQHGGGWW